MKKIVFCLVLFAMSLPACFADELRLDKEIKYQKQVMEVGFRVLNSNQIEKRMTFSYNSENIIKPRSYKRSKNITLYKGIIPYFDDENEIAAVISREIIRGLDSHAGIWRRSAMNMKPVAYEHKTDKKAVDLMVNAGYNPVALIVVLNKLLNEPTTFVDKMLSGKYFDKMSHSPGSARLANIYEYIYTKYPAYLVENDYKNNLYYQNFLLTSKPDRERVRQKYSEKNVVPVNNKTGKSKT